MWDIVLVIVIILLIKYLFGGPSASAPVPEAGSTMEILKKSTAVKKSRASKPLTEVLNECDLVVLYFSAHWCPPCKMFTPVLADVYKQLKDQGKKFEVIFVSSDKDEDAMYAYMAETHGDWYAIKYCESARSELGQHFGVRGIPTVIVLKNDGTVVSRDGRAEVSNKGAGVWDLWINPTI